MTQAPPAQRDVVARVNHKVGEKSDNGYTYLSNADIWCGQRFEQCLEGGVTYHQGARHVRSAVRSFVSGLISFPCISLPRVTPRPLIRERTTNVSLLPHRTELRNSLAPNVMKSRGARPRTGTRRGFNLGMARNKTLTLHAIPATICFRYDLGCGSEADVG
jgi:hypothetical protein